MENFRINFSNPWLLLLLIPALLLTLIPYFRLNKRYRCTRNRIVSMVLHAIIMVLAISVLAGIAIDYDLPNEQNEVILLVDASFSNAESETKKNDFIQAVIQNSDSKFKLGIVSFGYDQVYAVELTNNASTIFTDYLKAPMPDDSSTDIEAALKYTATLFERPESARIVLLTDAVETDGVSANVIKSIAASGITVDTVYFENKNNDDEVQLIGMERPEEKIKVGEPFEVALSIQSSFAGSARIIPYDNGIAGKPMDIELINGIQTVKIPFEFAVPGMHEMSFELSSSDDTLEQNNVFHSYIYLEIFDKILILESNEGESGAITRMLNDELNVTVIQIDDEERMPKTVKDLRSYDEVILCNISNSDLPQGFDKVLYSYVYDVGGGLFTICGNEYDSNPSDENWTANAYTRDDMYGSLYQEMLPVEIIEYTPPVAVMILIDVSGSMFNPEADVYETSRLFAAKQGAEACLDVLSERDYVGIIALSDEYTEEIELTPRTQRDKILAAIERVEGPGGTIFSTPLMKAGQALAAMTSVERKHIILITDGEPNTGDGEQDRYRAWMQENASMGITMSIVGVQCTQTAKANMITDLQEFAGMTDANFHDVVNIQNVPEALRKDLSAPEIKDVNYETFTPTITTPSEITAGVLQENMPTLDGFYGMKLKDGATEYISGAYTPIYSQWKFGNGTVGTFACDLNGTWSPNFIETPEGNTILNNIVRTLFPTESIRVSDVEIETEGDNYNTQLNVFTELLEGEYLEVTITSPAAEAGGSPLVQTLTATASDGYTKLNFAVKTAGIHEIRAQKKSAEGIVLAEAVTYKALSYSQEYNLFYDEKVAEELIQTLAEDGNGMNLQDAWEVFENAVKYLHRHIDPMIPFMITVIAFFLLDIAVRKFKWKWPHEIIRDKKAKAAMTANRS